MSLRLDEAMSAKGLVQSRSQASRLIKLGKVKVDGSVINKPGVLVTGDVIIEIQNNEKYVSRAGFKLASVAKTFQLDFKSKVVLDVGSSTGGFTDFALQNGAKLVVAVDVGTDQLHPPLRGDKRVELHEQTDIRDFVTGHKIDVVLVDVSFISLREVLPVVKKLCNDKTIIVAMLKPQFEAGAKLKNKGVIKNSTIRRKIVKDFEIWAKNYFFIAKKADSEVAGSKGNLERFYLFSK